MYSELKIRNRLAAGIAGLALVTLTACNSADQRAATYYANGNELQKDGEPAKAALEYRNALRLKKDFVDARVALANVEEAQGQYDAAVRDYYAVAEQSPTNIPARVSLVYLLLAAQQIEPAQKFAEEATKIAPNDARTLVAKAAVELKLNNRGESVRLARAALQANAKSIDAIMVLASERLMASDPAGALKYLDEAPEKSERNIGLQVLRLNALDALNDQPRVEQLFKKLAKLFPDKPAFHQALVKWYLTKGRKEDAETTMREFAANNPHDEKAELELVAFLNAEDGAPAAIAELRHAIETRSSNNSSAFSFRMALAQLQFASGDHADATAQMRSVITDADDTADGNKARIQLAKMLAALKSESQAETLVDEVIANDAKNVDALAVRAAIRMHQGKTDAAVDDLLAALNEAPDNIQIHELLADGYERQGQVTLAEEQYAKATSLSHNNPQAGLLLARFQLRYGKLQQALQTLETLRSRTPADRQVLSLLAEVKLNNQDWLGAQEIANTLRQLDKGNKDVTADRILAASLNGQDKQNESIQLLRSTFANTSNQQGVLADLVRTYVQTGRQQAAADFLISLVKSEPRNINAKILLGSVYLSMDKKNSAEDQFKQAAADDEGGLGCAALAQFYMSVGKVDEAEKAARSGLTRDEKSAALRLLLAAIYQQQQRFDEAISQYQILFKAQPDSPLIANDLASLLSERRGGTDALQEAYNIARRFANSPIPQYSDTLGWIYYLRGDYASALPLLKNAAQKLPKLALVQYHLGMALKALGQDQEAATHLQKAVSITPSLIEADLIKARQALEQARS